jgi:DNA repair protein RecO (recombination protein O)
MSRIERQPAFVLHQRPYRETSALLEVLTRDHGRVGLVARGLRGARPRFPRGVVVPLQALELDWLARGELGLLVAAEPVGTPMPIAGSALLSAIYVNELLVRLLPRHVPHPELVTRYARLLGDLCHGEPASQGWALRRFERDLLGSLGVAPPLDRDAAGHALDPDARYRLSPEAGAIAVGVAESRVETVSGRALLALADDAMPDREALEELRRTFRALIAHQLGGRPLKAWSLGGPTGGARGRSPR